MKFRCLVYLKIFIVQLFIAKLNFLKLYFFLTLLYSLTLIIILTPDEISLSLIFKIFLVFRYLYLIVTL